MSKDALHFIDGSYVVDSEENWLSLTHPVTGESSTRVLMGNQETVIRAVGSAKKAFTTWSHVSPTKRAEILFRYKTLLDQNTLKLAELISKEHGKTINDAKASVARGMAVLEYACGIPNLLKGELSMNVGHQVDCYSVRQPLGVCVGITPFNFPAMIPLWMYPLAIASGNTFILKPSPQDPSGPLLMAELFHEAGLPDGVLNVVNGDQLVVEALIEHPDVKAISFVGSTPVAQKIQQQAIKYHKRVQAFGGAKNHAVVMPDADIKTAANAIAGAAYGSAGERCMAISVVVAVGNIADPLIEALKQNIASFTIGASDDPEVMIGPLVSAKHRNRVIKLIGQGVDEGAKLVLDGRGFSHPSYPAGNFLGASLFDEVQPQMSIYTEEIFGPVLCVVRVPDYQAALEMINHCEYGNGTAIFTQDPAVARDFIEHVQVGMVGVNIPIPVPVAQHSFGGWKNSIFADVHMHGPEGIQFYTQLKSVTSTWPKTHSDPQFELPTFR